MSRTDARRVACFLSRGGPVGSTASASTPVSWSSCDDVVSRSCSRWIPGDDAEALLTIARIHSFTLCTCTCKCKSFRRLRGLGGIGQVCRKASAVPRSGLPHALLHLFGPHGHHRKRRDALTRGLHAVEDQGQVPAPDA